MARPLDAAAVRTYALAYAGCVCERAYATTTRLSGEQVLQCSSVQQVNLFVIRSLQQKWRETAQAFQSPYFDFSHADVQGALQAFMNVVSQHISLPRTALEPLLADATEQTLTLLMEPQAFLQHFIGNQPGNTLRPEALTALLKYVRLNRSPVEQLLSGLPAPVPLSQALQQVQDIFQEKPPLDSAGAVLSALQQAVPLPPNGLWAGQAPGTQNFFDALDAGSGDLPTVNKILKQQDDPVRSDPTPPHAPPAAVQPPAAIPLRQPLKPAAPPQEPAGEPLTLNDLHARRRDDTPVITLADRFRQKPIESLQSHISLNHKFIFINQLFHGDAVAYHRAVEEIDKADNFEAAEALMQSQYAEKYLWRMAPDEAEDFAAMVRRRFQG